MKKTFSILIVSAVIVISCDKKQSTATHYPIIKLLHEQAVELANLNATVKKTAWIGSKVDTATLRQLDSTSWKKELEIFELLNSLNKPVNQTKYLVDDHLYDPGSNLTVKAFTAKDEEDETLPVRSVRIFYSDDALKPRKIEAVYQEQNALFKNLRQLSLEFQQVNNKTLLTSYSVDGGQKMIMGDTVSYAVHGKIALGK